jgi:hypothetical protein
MSLPPLPPLLMVADTPNRLLPSAAAAVAVLLPRKVSL